MILIKNAKIVDGTGKPPFSGDLLIKDDKISAIGQFPKQRAEVVIDGLGLTVTPGFIDVHSTSDHYLTLFTAPLQPDFLLQGVSTIIGGYCGSSLAPLLYGSLKSIRKWSNPDQINVDWGSLAEFKATLKRSKIGVNFGTFVGHSTIRRDLIGEEIRDLTQTEVELFQSILKEAFEEGALGLSTGLSYAHSRNVSFSEIKNLLKTVTDQNRIYATHLRDEYNLLSSVEETLKMAEETGAPIIISHFRPLLGLESQFRPALELIEKNLSSSNIYLEMNPFNTSVIPIYTLLPSSVQTNNLENMLEIIADQNQRGEIVRVLAANEASLAAMAIAKAPENNYVIGKTIKDFAESRSLSIAEGLLALMRITKMKALLFYQNIDLQLLRQTLPYPRSLIGSNSASASESGSTLKLERSTETFTKFLEITAANNIPLEEAIKKITYAPAKMLGLKKRGALLEGWFADLTMLKDNKINNVIINGQLAVQDGKISGKLAGVPL